MTILNNFRVKFSSTLKVEFKAVKAELGYMKTPYLFKGLNVLLTVELSNLNYDVSPENLEFRKSLFPNLRFWMAEIIKAGKAGELSREEVILMCTFVRAAAVQRITILRNRYPQASTKAVAKPILVAEVIEVVECDENGRPITEVQLEVIQNLREENSNLTAETANLKAKIKTQKEDIKTKNKALRIKDEQIKVLKSALHTVVELGQYI